MYKIPFLEFSPISEEFAGAECARMDVGDDSGESLKRQQDAFGRDATAKKQLDKSTERPSNVRSQPKQRRRLRAITRQSD